jgi:hypothetical protein
MTIATLTPADGELGADNTSFPLSASSMSSTSNATWGTALTRSDIGLSASNLIHSTPYGLSGKPDTYILNCGR